MPQFLAIMEFKYLEIHSLKGVTLWKEGSGEPGNRTLGSVLGLVLHTQTHFPSGMLTLPRGAHD